MTNFDYYSYRINSVTEKINEELDFYENSEYSKTEPINEYITYLRGRITLSKPASAPITHYDRSGNKCELSKMNMDEYVKDMDILVFRKPWNKLKEFHKIMKIKEFVDNLTYGKKAKQSSIDKNKEFLKKEICGGLKTKKFCKNKSEIVYDEINMIITSISSVDFNKKTGLYDLDWDS